MTENTDAENTNSADRFEPDLEQMEQELHSLADGINVSAFTCRAHWWPV